MTERPIGEYMEKEIDINRRKIVMYYGLIGLLPCLLLIPVFGVGLILAVIQVVLTVLLSKVGKCPPVLLR